MKTPGRGISLKWITLSAALAIACQGCGDSKPVARSWSENSATVADSGKVSGKTSQVAGSRIINGTTPDGRPVTYQVGPDGTYTEIPASSAAAALPAASSASGIAKNVNSAEIGVDSADYREPQTLTPFESGTIPPNAPQFHMQLERDAVNPMDKPEMGLHINPREWNEARFNPDRLSDRITSQGQRGVTQHTFAETGGDFNAHIDPTSKFIYMTTTRYSQAPQVAMQNVRSMAVTLLTEDNMSDMMPKVSPDNKWLAWCSNRYGNWDILVQRVGASPDSRPQQITRATEDDIHPSWSHDGRLLAFSRYNSMDGAWGIWVVDMQTRTLSYITEGLFPEFKPVGNDDANVYTMAYQRHRKRDVPWYSVWTIDSRVAADGSIEAVNYPQEIIGNDQWAAITPAWNPEGTHLVFASVRKSPLAQMQSRIYKADDIWVVRIDGNDLTQITSHSAPDWNPTWAKEEGNPFGRIYFTSLRNGHANIWSVKPIIAGLISDQRLGATAALR